MQRIIKTDHTHRTATFVILEPEVEDRNGDIISADEIIKTAHNFVRGLPEKRVNMNHEPDTDQTDVEFVESFIAPVDIHVGSETILAGSWLVGFRFSREKWEALQRGEIVGVSMEGFGFFE